MPQHVPEHCRGSQLPPADSRPLPLGPAAAPGFLLMQHFLLPGPPDSPG